MSYLKQNLRYLRHVKNLNQEEFGALFGLSRDNIASYERGIEPRLDVLSLIGKKLHIQLDALLNTDLGALPPRNPEENISLTAPPPAGPAPRVPSPAPAGEAPAPFEEALPSPAAETLPSPVGVPAPAAEVPAPAAAEGRRKAEGADRKLAKTRSLPQVPVFNLAAPGGLAGFSDNREGMIDFVYIPNMPPCDGAVYITGESMYPLLRSGDMVLFQFTSDLDQGIFYGEMYLVSFFIGKQEFTALKFIQPSDLGAAYLKLVSHNQHFGSKDIPRKAVRALALVKASIRLNSM
jgi:transcriptional regulator with XRE-family HTH domain